MSAATADAVTALRGSVFGELDGRALRRLAARCTEVDVAAGDVVIREGEVGDCAYVVVHGRLAAVRGDGHVAEIGPGDVVGELALLRRGRRAATVTAMRDTRVLRLAADDFTAVVSEHPAALMALTGRLAESVASRREGQARTAPVRAIAVVAAGAGAGRHATRFGRSLATALGRMGRARLVTRRLMEDALGADAADAGPNGAGAAPVAAFLERIESDHDYVVLQGDAPGTAWTARCARQADVVVVVADADRSAALDVSALGRSSAHVHAVLLRTGGGPRGAAVWASDPRVSAHHHVRSGDAADVHRVARAVVGRAVGVVLGGGGPRGFAHLGVVRAIEEAGIPIDLVGGTSIGAILGASVAMGWDHHTRVERAVDAFVRTRFLLRPTLPFASLMSARKLTTGFQRTFGAQQIEDMPLPFFCVSANLSRADAVVHDTGPTWFALRATSSMPGVLPPVHHGGDLLVDGGVVNDLPVDVMRLRTAGRVIGVDLSTEVELRVAHDFGPSVTGLDVLRRRLNPFTPRYDVPGPIATLLRAKDVSAIRAHRERLAGQVADLVLRPPTGVTGALDFKSGPALIELGYRYASEALERWPGA